ncbi:MAG TPA: hypothetical protein VK661_11375 [Planctomycetota bacterium]|nr:hypothetical protein [Planctomycetota bacterium]
MFPTLALLILVGCPAPDEKDELLAAAKRAAEVKSYSFRGETRLALPEGMARAGGSDPVKFEGKVERETGAWVKTDSYEFVTVGGKTVARPSADWKLIKEEDETEIQRGLFRGLASSRPVRAPHEEFAGYARVVTKAKKAEAKESVGDRECQVYEAEFSEEAARDMARALFPMGRWLDRMPEAKYSAGTKAWVDGDGRILKVETSVKISASVQGNDIEMSATRSATITDIDATKLEIPDPVKKALEGK